MDNTSTSPKQTVAKTPGLYILRLFTIAPLLIAIYAGVQVFLISQVEPAVLTLDEFRNSPPERGNKVTLTGGGLYIGHHFSNHPEDSEEPTHWWVAYVTESELPALLAAREDGSYPLEQLVLIELTPQQYRNRYPQTLGVEHAFIKEEFTGAFRRGKDVPLRVWFTVAESYSLSKWSSYFFEIGGEQTATFNFKGLLIFAGILAVPFTIWFLTTFVPPLEPKPSANEWANHSSTPPPEVLERLNRESRERVNRKKTGPQKEAGDSA